MALLFTPSKIQEQFWLATSMYPNNIAYNVPLVFILNDIPNLNSLEKALNLIVKNNESLRAIFDIVDGQLLQSITNIETGEIKVIVEKSSSNLNRDEVSALIQTESDYCFDLSKFPLLRVKLIHFADSKSLLTIVFHHIIIDLTSRDLFCRDLSTYYNMIQSGQPVLLDETKTPYKEYIERENNWLTTDQGKQKLDNWLKKYNNPTELLNLPFDRQKTIRTTPVGNQQILKIDHLLTEQIKGFVQKNSITPFLFLFTCYAVLLHRLSSQDKIIISVPFPNRNRESDKLVISCYVNNLPITIDFSENLNFKQLIDQIRKEFLFVHRNQEVPLLEIINHITIGNDRSTNPIFQVGFTQEPLAKIDLNGIFSESILVDRHGAQIELFLKIIELEESLTLAFEYNADLFEKETIKHWSELYKQIIRSCLTPETKPINQLNILPQAEADLIENWNETVEPYEKDSCVHHKLEQLSLIHPDRPALRFKTKVLTYKELNDHSNRLANYLIEKGILVEDIVAISVERSFEMMIGIFGILKAGATYLPLDPKNPQNRMNELIDDAKPKIILTDSKSDTNLPAFPSTIYLDHILEHPFHGNNSNPSIGVKSNNLAYIIYTSGSTGKPKGVMIEHHSLMNRLDWMQKQFPISLEDVLLQKTSITFDVSVWELFWWSFNGASLAILPPGAEREPLKIVSEIAFHKVTVIHFVPSMFSVFIDYLKASHTVNSISGLKWIIASGEALQPKTVNEFNKLRAYSELPEVINLYGPTEATIDVSIYKCSQADDIKEIPIGKTIDNTKLYILSKADQVQPWGVPGELVIAGVNLARGYLNNEELTNKKFPHIHLNEGGDLRIYRTGDLAKWNSEGDIIFIGRVDNQIKIRGFRIELGEIEAKLLEFSKIKEASVILQNSNSENPVLKAFVVLFPDEKTKSEDIKKYLVERLPNYMVPNQIFILEKMPVSANGKIDRKILMTFDSGKEEIINSNPSVIEQNLSNLVTELLGIKTVRITDNFFDLGGNSLMAIRLTSLLYERYELKLEVVKIFEFPTIKDLAGFLSSIKSNLNTISLASTASRRALKYAHKSNLKRRD